MQERRGKEERTVYIGSWFRGPPDQIWPKHSRPPLPLLASQPYPCTLMASSLPEAEVDRLLLRQQLCCYLQLCGH